jgi:hypothetical protein
MQETGRAKQLTILMAFFHQDLFQDEHVLNAHHGGNQYLLYRFGCR